MTYVQKLKAGYTTAENLIIALDFAQYLKVTRVSTSQIPPLYQMNLRSLLNDPGGVIYRSHVTRYIINFYF